MESYLTDLYTHQLSAIPTGLIIYDNANPKNVRLVKNVTSLVGTAATPRTVTVERFWAKHQDLPIPLFHLILHYYYLKKVNHIGGDPFEILYTTKLVPPSVLTTFAAVPVQDVSGVNIKTLSGRKDIKHFEKQATLGRSKMTSYTFPNMQFLGRLPSKSPFLFLSPA